MPKTLNGAEEPEDAYATYRAAYTSLMRSIAVVMRKSTLLGGRR